MGEAPFVMSKTDKHTIVINGAYRAVGAPGVTQLMTQIINCKCDECSKGEGGVPRECFS